MNAPHNRGPHTTTNASTDGSHIAKNGVSGKDSNTTSGMPHVNGASKGDASPGSTAGDPSADQGGAVDQYKLKEIQLDLNNLVKVDDKLCALAEALKKNNIGVISQLCSDWWELTDEDDYAVSKFQAAYKDERAKKDIKQ